MKKPIVLILIVTVILCGIGGLVVTMFSKANLAAQKDVVSVKVERGEIMVKVVETGSIDAVKTVELRSRASGRLKELLVDEGATVSPGQLVALIDPQETELRVRQDRAQVRGASSAVARTAIEIRQQQASLNAAYQQARVRLATLEQELGIQPTLTRTSIDQAKAQLESAQKSRRTLVTVTHPNQRTDLVRAVTDAKNSHDLAEREFHRQEELLSKGYVAGRTVESAKLQLDLEKSKLDAANVNLARLEELQRLELQRADDEVRIANAGYERALANRIQNDSKRREYQQAVLDVDRARAAMLQVPILRQSQAQSAASVDQLQSVLEDSMRQLRETQVRAPFAGVVSKKYIEIGDLVTGLSAFTSGTAIMRIEDRSSMRVKLEMNEIDVARLTEGMMATIDIDALPTQSLTGHVRKIAPASTAITSQSTGAASSDAVVKYTVEVYLDSTVPAIRTGMSAKCTLKVIDKPNVLRIPIAYLGKDEKGSFVMLAPEKGKPGAKGTRREVKVGSSTGAYVEIVSGVSAGDSIVKPDYKGPKRTGMMDAGADN